MGKVPPPGAIAEVPLCHLPRPQIGEENRNLCHLTHLCWNPGPGTPRLVSGKPLKGKVAQFPPMHKGENNPSSPGTFEN